MIASKKTRAGRSLVVISPTRYHAAPTELFRPADDPAADACDV